MTPRDLTLIRPYLLQVHYLLIGAQTSIQHLYLGELLTYALSGTA